MVLSRNQYKWRGLPLGTFRASSSRLQSLQNAYRESNVKLLLVMFSNGSAYSLQLIRQLNCPRVMSLSVTKVD